MPKIKSSWNTLALWICCVYILPDWLQIMYQLVNIGLGSSWRNLLHVHVIIILLRWEGTFFLNVYDTRSFGIQRENCLKIFLLS